MKHAIFQIDIIPGEPEENRRRLSSWVKDVVAEELPDTIVLPEMWTTAYTLPELDEVADTEGEPTIPFLQGLAKNYHINIVGGSFANKKGGEIYNTAVVIQRGGEVVYQYDKIHLVPMLEEEKYLAGGKQKAEIFELDGVKMGVIICYDLRFPELARSLALQGAQVLYVVAEWPMARRDHWRALQTARAIENQLFVVSSNRIGSYNNEIFAGSSMIIDPWGKCLGEGDESGEEILIETLSLQDTVKIRKDVPVFSSRVPELYD